MEGVEVGEGFYNEWNDLMPQVIPAVQALVADYPDYDIFVTGHSLGGFFLIILTIIIVIYFYYYYYEITLFIYNNNNNNNYYY